MPGWCRNIFGFITFFTSLAFQFTCSDCMQRTHNLSSAYFYISRSYTLFWKWIKKHLILVRLSAIETVISNYSNSNLLMLLKTIKSICDNSMQVAIPTPSDNDVSCRHINTCATRQWDGTLPLAHSAHERLRSSDALPYSWRTACQRSLHGTWCASAAK